MFGVGSILESVLTTAVSSMQDTVEKFESNEDESKALVDAAERMSGLRGMDPVDIKTRKWRLRTFKSVFVGRDAVEWLMTRGVCKNQRDAVVLGNRMVRLKIIQRVNGAGRFENANFFYRFAGNYRQAERLDEADIKRLGFSHNDLAQVVAAMYNDPTPLVARSFQTLTVIGSAATTFFLARNFVTNTRDAVILGNLLIKDALLVPGHYKHTPGSGAGAGGNSTAAGNGNGHGNGASNGYHNHPTTATSPTASVNSISMSSGDEKSPNANSAAAAAITVTSTGYPFRNADLPYLLSGALLDAHIQSERSRELALQKAERERELAAQSKSESGPPTPHQQHFTAFAQQQQMATTNGARTSQSGPSGANANGSHTKTNSSTASSTASSTHTGAGGAHTPHSGSFSAPSGNMPPVHLPLASNAASGLAASNGSIVMSPMGLPKHPNAATGASVIAPPGGAVASNPVAVALAKASAAAETKASLAKPADDSLLPVQFDWEFVQSFGDDSSAYDYDDAEDLVTAVEFDHSGEYLAIGDKAGRISIVQETTQRQKNMPLEYKFYTEFQSHEPEFDALKSVETEPKINVIKWWKHHTHSMHLLTCNDKTIKLWRIGEKRIRPKTRRQSLVLSLDHRGDFTPVEDEAAAAGGAASVVKTVHKSTFRNAHGYNIHSLSVNCDGETFFSADDLRINMWNVGRSDECMTIVDVKPDHVTDIDELITAAAFHPTHCHLLMYGSSKGAVRLGDMRQRALVDRHTTHFENKNISKKTYFSEITNSILDAKFSSNGRYLIARDYMTVRLWDVHMPSKPLSVHQVHPQFNTQPQLSALLENECIFDQFQCAISHDGLHFVTGSYSNSFLLQNTLTKTGITIEARDDVREPRICAVQSQPFIAANESKSRLTNTAAAAAAAAASTGTAATGTAASDPNAAAAAALKMSKAQAAAAAAALRVPVVNHKLESVAYRNKVLRVAWHPRLNAVAVAGLYKLYLYQTKPNA